MFLILEGHNYAEKCAQHNALLIAEIKPRRYVRPTEPTFPSALVLSAYVCSGILLPHRRKCGLEIGMEKLMTSYLVRAINLNVR